MQIRVRDLSRHETEVLARTKDKANSFMRDCREIFVDCYCCCWVDIGALGAAVNGGVSGAAEKTFVDIGVIFGVD
jgi:hypothetical protein